MKYLCYYELVFLNASIFFPSLFIGNSSPFCSHFLLNYLDVNITSSGNLVKEIETQAQKATRVIVCLNDLVWRKKIYDRKQNQ